MRKDVSVTKWTSSREARLSGESGTTADWSISDTAIGWQLQVRLRTPLSFLLPRYLKRNLVQIILDPLLAWSMFLFIAWRAIGVLTLPVISLMALAAIVLTVVVWPFRFARGGTPDRFLPDGTVLACYYYLRYFDANRTIRIAQKDGKLDVGGNLFEPHRLNSLVVDDEVNDGYPGMVDLSFAGAAVSKQSLIGWPGLPPHVAPAIRDALLDRILAVSERAAAGR